MTEGHATTMGGTAAQPVKPVAAAAPLRKFRVLLPVLIGQHTYEFGQTVELDVATAKEYAHALLPEEGK
jgi:hypothetical protein